MIEAVGKSWRNPNLCKDCFVFSFSFFQACNNREAEKLQKQPGSGGEAAKRQQRLSPGPWVLSRGREAAAGEGRVKSSFCA